MKDKKQHIETELSEIAPLLAKLKSKDAFATTADVPSDYFNELSNHIFDNTILKTPTSNKPAVQSADLQQSKHTIWTKVHQYFQNVSRIGVAAVGTVALVTIGFALLKPSEQVIQEASVDLTYDDVEEYIGNNIEIFDEEQLTEYVFTSVYIEPTIIIEEISTEILEEYIDDNLIDDITIDDLL